MTSSTKPTSVIQVEVLVPAPVAEAERAAFEQAMVQFVFGADRVRPELREDLAAAGVNFNQLANLSQNPRLGVCPAPGALEFVPSEHLMQVCGRHGISLTDGGSVQLSFRYPAAGAAGAAKQPGGNQLEVNLRVPAPVRAEASTSDDLTADVVRALFGDCQLAAPAQAYLRAHGVDLTEIAARNVDQLGGPEAPFTSRVNPAVHRYLSDQGFSVDRFGQFAVRRVDETTTGEGDGLSWSKTTCC